MMKQREHEALDTFAILRKFCFRLGRGSAPNYRSLRTRQPVFSCF
jgi:hypothetical protein